MHHAGGTERKGSRGSSGMQNGCLGPLGVPGPLPKSANMRTAALDTQGAGQGRLGGERRVGGGVCGWQPACRTSLDGGHLLGSVGLPRWPPAGIRAGGWGASVAAREEAAAIGSTYRRGKAYPRGRGTSLKLQVIRLRRLRKTRQGQDKRGIHTPPFVIPRPENPSRSPGLVSHHITLEGESERGIVSWPRWREWECNRRKGRGLPPPRLRLKTRYLLRAHPVQRCSLRQVLPKGEGLLRALPQASLVYQPWQESSDSYSPAPQPGPQTGRRPRVPFAGSAPSSRRRRH